MDFQLHKADKVWYPGAEEELTAVPPAYLYINPYVFAPAKWPPKNATRGVSAI